MPMPCAPPARSPHPNAHLCPAQFPHPRASTPTQAHILGSAPPRTPPCSTAMHLHPPHPSPFVFLPSSEAPPLTAPPSPPPAPSGRRMRHSWRASLQIYTTYLSSRQTHRWGGENVVIPIRHSMHAVPFDAICPRAPASAVQSSTARDFVPLLGTARITRTCDAASLLSRYAQSPTPC